MFKLTGTVKVIQDTVQVSEKFQKKEFIIETSDQYPQEIIFQCAQEKVNLLDPIMEGENVEVSFNVRGKSWTNPQGETKWFNSLDCWKIDKL